MEKKPSTAAPGAPPVGVCEKLFNALQIHPGFTTIRRLTYRQPAAASADPAPLPVPMAPPMATVHKPNPPPGPPLQSAHPSPAIHPPHNTPALVPATSTLGPDRKVHKPAPAPPPAALIKEKGSGKMPVGRAETSVVKTTSMPPQATQVQPTQAAAEETKNTGQPAEKPKRNTKRWRRALTAP